MEGQSKRPKNSAFKQQRLKAWQPLLTPKTVLPAFFLVGLVFIPLGIALYLTSNSVNEIVMDYTTCSTDAGASYAEHPGGGYEWRKNASDTEIVCHLRFTLNQDFEGPVFLYYRLTNFYQNHRRYVKSFNSDQLRGKAVPPRDLGDCSPIDYVTPSPTTIEPTVGYYPCGLIANSLFNDTFSNLTSENGDQFVFSEKGITWAGDKDRYKKTDYGKDSPPGLVLDNMLPPPNWAKYNGTYTSDNIPDLSEDEHFQVWMRTAGLPTFRKLYGRSDETLSAGTYEIQITDRYPVVVFDGTKSLVISTSSWMGGKNPFLGIAYLVVGSICIALGVAFLIRHLVAPRKLGDHSYIKWK